MKGEMTAATWITKGKCGKAKYKGQKTGIGESRRKRERRNVVKKDRKQKFTTTNKVKGNKKGKNGEGREEEGRKRIGEVGRDRREAEEHRQQLQRNKQNDK